MIVMRQCGLILGSNRSTPVSDVASGEGCACVGAEGGWEISMLSFQYCSKLESALKITSFQILHIKELVKWSMCQMSNVLSQSICLTRLFGFVKFSQMLGWVIILRHQESTGVMVSWSFQAFRLAHVHS